ncbi:hypothetical protein [Dactylosporangium sp. NPDC006015]|uniref:hypothetical protein n=1 Tax=Dactylosporangium sp. NPDC006015 TaxID=3154576 RepID=UPI0033BF6156
MRRWWWLAAAALAVCGGLAYLDRDRDPLTDADVVGTWCSADRGELVFGADHRFTARDILNVALAPAVEKFRPGPGGETWRSDGAGTWKVVPRMTDRRGPATEIDLHFRTLNGRPEAYGTRLVSVVRDEVVRDEVVRDEVVRDEVVRDERLVLLFTVGDPDNGAEYRFVRKGCP